MTGVCKGEEKYFRKGSSAVLERKEASPTLMWVKFRVRGKKRCLLVDMVQGVRRRKRQRIDYEVIGQSDWKGFN